MYYDILDKSYYLFLIYVYPLFLQCIDNYETTTNSETETSDNEM